MHFTCLFDLSKVKTKYGRNNSLLDIPDKNLDGRRWLLFVYLPDMIPLLPICIALAAFSLSDKRNELMDKYRVPEELSTEIRNHRDIGKREDFLGDDFLLSSEP
ncbi:hypothetical protein NPIL_188221 [Nephila pilipes]|uniref:Uncharacterized protein n=1 Tax=Nephila pilipes TaxID=299642 RepID=A0A8X6QL64_NEPPI|nr:hypothetical protein NPIL_188221 [Nephila pilipes]